MGNAVSPAAERGTARAGRRLAPTLPTLPGGGADGFARTSPVGSFARNPLGFYDLGGNDWEWCVDRFAPGGETRVLRGGSWGNVRADLLLSGKRIDAFPNARSDLYGFRVVLETRRSGG